MLRRRSVECSRVCGLARSRVLQSCGWMRVLVCGIKWSEPGFDTTITGISDWVYKALEGISCWLFRNGKLFGDVGFDMFGEWLVVTLATAVRLQLEGHDLREVETMLATGALIFGAGMR